MSNKSLITYAIKEELLQSYGLTIKCQKYNFSWGKIHTSPFIPRYLNLNIMKQVKKEFLNLELSSEKKGFRVKDGIFPVTKVHGRAIKIYKWCRIASLSRTNYNHLPLLIKLSRSEIVWFLFWTCRFDFQYLCNNFWN